MEAKIPPESSDPPMICEDELERLLAIELACECLLAHNEHLELLAANAGPARAAA